MLKEAERSTRPGFKRPVIAILLSAFILPGLGQLYIGRRIKGVILIAAVNLLLMVSLFFVMKLSSPLIAARISGEPLTAALLLKQIEPYRSWARLILAGFFGLWGFSLIDLFSAFREENRNQNMER